MTIRPQEEEGEDAGSFAEEEEDAEDNRLTEKPLNVIGATSWDTLHMSALRLRRPTTLVSMKTKK